MIAGSKTLRLVQSAKLIWSTNPYLRSLPRLTCLHLFALYIFITFYWTISAFLSQFMSWNQIAGPNAHVFLEFWNSIHQFVIRLVTYFCTIMITWFLRVNGIKCDYIIIIMVLLETTSSQRRCYKFNIWITYI